MKYIKKNHVHKWIYRESVVLDGYGYRSDEFIKDSNYLVSVLSCNCGEVSAIKVASSSDGLYLRDHI